MTKPDVKKMFQAADAANEARIKALGAVDEATEKRSNIIKEIAETVGTGPFEWNGQILTIRKRDTKDENEKVLGTNYFFVSQSQNEVQKIG